MEEPELWHKASPEKNQASIIGIAFLFIMIVGTTGCRNNPETDPIDLQELTIADIHSAYEAGIFTADQLTGAYLSRIAELDK